MTTTNKELGLIEVGFDDFVNEVLPRTVDGHYKGETNEEKFADFQQKYSKRQGLFVKKFGYGERIAIKFYFEV